MKSGQKYSEINPNSPLRDLPSLNPIVLETKELDEINLKARLPENSRY